MEVKTMKANWSRVALVGCLALLLVACDQIAAPALPDDTIPSSTVMPLGVQTQKEPATALPAQELDKDGTQMAQPASTPSSSGLEGLIEKAKEELAQRLSISVPQIRLVEARGVVWPNSSMGCPQPGMRYIQVPYDGALIILEVEGELFEYHVGGNRGLFLCEMVYKDPNTPPQIDITTLTPSTRNSNNPTPPTPDNGIPPGGDQ
jgi:hypothetical protein